MHSDDITDFLTIEVIPAHEYLHILLRELKLAEYLTLPAEDHKLYRKVSVNEKT